MKHLTHLVDAIGALSAEDPNHLSLLIMAMVRDMEGMAEGIKDLRFERGLLSSRIQELEEELHGKTSILDDNIRAVRCGRENTRKGMHIALDNSVRNGKRALANTKRSIKTSIRLGIAQKEIASLKARIEKLEQNVALKADPAFEAYLTGEDYAEGDEVQAPELLGEPNEYVLCFRCQSSILEDENPQWDGKPVCEDDYRELCAEQEHNQGE